ncbi:Oligopeptide-binding protein AppA [invertebrate metagenome]|uniref:Oligopeptide-binding protein AppA n=1 Tax=invertebrate metagenome TaxID=1711999 RepID=A0A2H9T494_9ZZZZ
MKKLLKHALLLSQETYVFYVLFLCCSSVIHASSEASSTDKKSSDTAHATYHAISLYGKPKYSEGFTHFGYANAKAPKGGKLKQAAIGNFDSLNPYIDKGIAAAGSNLLFDTLLARSWDEPLTKYGLIAERIESDPNNWWVAFHVNPKAYFHDGVPVTANDVVFSFYLLREKGSAFYKTFYREIKDVKATSSHRVLFSFTTNKNRELPLILGQMPVMPQHYWESRNFSVSSLDVPVGSGPYKVSHISPGRSISFERDVHYWGAHIAPNKGRYNFNTLTYEYFRDTTVAMEALLAGEYDVKVVEDPRTWYDRLDEQRLKQQGFIRSLFNNSNPQTLTLAYNTQKPSLSDKRVRQALGYAFDFDWINQHLFHGMYTRANSYFSGTSLAATGTPSLGELKLLDPVKKQLPDALFKRTFVPSGAEKNLSLRQKQKTALSLLSSAGWLLKKNQLQDQNGNPLILEVLLSQADQERIMLNMKKNLEMLGIVLSIRTVDSAQYIERIRNQDFDIILHTFPHTSSPGTEQANYWASYNAGIHGTRNVTGASNPVIDRLTSEITEATSWDSLQSAVRAMDRVLLWDHYTLPLWFLPQWPTVYKSSLKHPKRMAPFALDIMTWWHEE